MSGEKNNAGQRSIGREVDSDGDDGLSIVAISREPTVIEALVLADEIQMLLTGLSESHAKALELRMGGHTPTEAAELMGISRQSFYRLLDPLKERLEERGELVKSLPLAVDDSDEAV